MISIIIPTYNRRKMLSKALDSIFNQTYKDIEVIVIDDNSNDDTEEYILSLNSPVIKYIKNKQNLFAHISRKIGYSHCSGDYVIFMDDDDFYIDTDFLLNVEKIFKTYKEVSTVIASTISYNNSTYETTVNLGGSGVINQIDYINNFSKSYNKPHSTLSLVCRKKSLDRRNFKNFNMFNDTCIYLFTLLDGDVYLLNQSVAAYRIHSTNISKVKFENEFIRETLNAKLYIFKLALEDKLLIDPNNWIAYHLDQSAFYFINSSGKDLKTIFFIIIWYIKNTHFIFQFLFNSFKRVLSSYNIL